MRFAACLVVGAFLLGVLIGSQSDEAATHLLRILEIPLWRRYLQPPAETPWLWKGYLHNRKVVVSGLACGAIGFGIQPLVANFLRWPPDWLLLSARLRRETITGMVNRLVGAPAWPRRVSGPALGEYGRRGGDAGHFELAPAHPRFCTGPASGRASGTAGP